MKYEFDSRIRFSECDENRTLTMTGLVNYFQDCATFQAEDYGIGFRDVWKQGGVWVISSWQIVIDRMPKFNEKVTAATWAYEFKDFYGHRNFTLTDENGKAFAWANSVWAMIDHETQRPIKVYDSVTERYGLTEKLDMDYAPRKILLRKADLEAARQGSSFLIEKQHLDTNHHVNNCQYISMAQEHLPEGFQIRQMRAEYKQQARLGDRITPVIITGRDSVTVALNADNGRPYAVVEFTTENNDQRGNLC